VLIDWFTVAAQVVNFLILIWLLKHFLYDRIIKAIDEREASIAGRFAEAEDREAKARRSEQELAAQKQKLEAESRKILEQVKQEADQRRGELVARAKEDVESQRGAWQESLERDRQALAGDLARLAAQGAAGMARQALEELADANLDQRALEVFLQKLGSLDDEARQELKAALADTKALVVRSAFELDQPQGDRLRQALVGLAEGEPNLEFETDPELLLGLEIRLPGRKLAWSLDEYLREMGQQVDQRLERSLRGLGDKADKAREQSPGEDHV
jgi:F-type H+-transporting ATPase subunit b